MKRLRVLGLTLLQATTILVAAGPAKAQDSHYWAQQYGTRATLLGGAMIGSARDLSAVYYNPGAIALIGEQGFVLSARAYGFSKLTLQDGAGPGRDLDSSATEPLPTMLAGALRFDFLGRSRLAYTLLTRNQFEANVASSRIEQRDVLSVPGTEQLASSFDANASIGELWAGLAWSYPLGERFGIGATQFLSARDQTVGFQLLAQAATAAGDVAIATRNRRRSYTSYRTLWKVGIGANLGALTWGASLTTPSISLGGSGTSMYNTSVAALDIDGDGNDDPLLASNLQDDVPATFKSSWAFGVGAAYGIGSSRIHVSAEWFAAQEPFTALGPEPFLGQTSGQPIENDLTGEFASIVNWGVGFEHTLAGGSSLYASFALDRSAAASDLTSDMVLTEYDLHRIGAGGSFDFRGTEILVGISRAGGSDTFPRLVDFDELVTSGDVLGGEEEVDLDFRQWTLVFGFQLGGGGG